MNEMRKLMETTARLFDDRVESDTDRYYADQERAEQEAAENLPYDIEDAENYFLNDPAGKTEFADYFIENLVENPREFDIDLMIGILQDYFRNLGDGALPVQFAESETMNDVLASYLQKQGYNIDASEIEQYRSRTDESLLNSEVSYDTSGETDYFERYDELPDNINNLIDTHFSGDGGYEYSELEDILKKFEEQGWTFDYGLDGSPYGLKPKD